LIENLRSAGEWSTLESELGDPIEETLACYLGLFDDPKKAAYDEARRIKALPLVPPDVVVHALYLDLRTGVLELVSEGSDAAAL